MGLFSAIFSENYTDFDIRDGVLVKYTGNATDVTIPASVRSIGDEAFGDCKSLKSITIPDSVTKIKSCAFARCTSLKSITIPASVRSIGEFAFNQCCSLHLIVDNGNPAYTVVDNVLFSKNYSLLHTFLCCNRENNYVVPDSVSKIGDYAFAFCDSLQSITIPASVTTIGEYAFLNCKLLQSITIPDSVTSIGKSAFYGCESLVSITISNSVTTIGDRAFYGCESLESITIPDSVATIGDGAFEYCKSLRTITIPKSIKKIAYHAFEHCESLESITIPDSVTKIDSGAFEHCESLESITIPDSVTTLGYGVFGSCKNLKAIILPNKSLSYFTRDQFPWNCKITTNEIIADEEKRAKQQAARKKKQEAKKLEAKRVEESTVLSQNALNLFVTNTEQKDVDVTDIDKSQVDITLYLRSVVDMFACIDVLKKNLQALYYEKYYQEGSPEADDTNSVTTLFLDGSIPKAEQALVDSILHLKKLLALDIVHPKYQEYVPLCSICEYFELGRVDKLTGPDGAYNLYESEYRLGTIINKLDTIADKLEDIKAGQYTLYSAIVSTNKQISKLEDSLKTSLKDIDKTVKRNSEAISQQLGVLEYNTAATAYYAKVNAEIAAAPRFGIIF